MATTVPYLLFSLDRYDRPSTSIRTVGGVIIAMEDPVYVGRLLVGSDVVEDKSDLVVPGRMTDRLFKDLQAISEQPGAEVTRQHGELFTLFDDPAMTERREKVAFIRHGTYPSFVRKTDRYEQLLREFVDQYR